MTETKVDRGVKEDVLMDATEIKRSIRNYYKSLYDNKLEN